MALRAEYAKLMGYKNYAEYSLVETMAKTPDAVAELLGQVWPKAVARAREERDALQAHAASEGDNSEVAAWDWRYYAEKVRSARYDLDEAEIQPLSTARKRHRRRIRLARRGCSA